MDLNLKKKIVLIAGASKGLGYAIAENYIKEDSQVIITSSNLNNLKKAEKKLKKKYKQSQIYPYLVDHENISSVAKFSKKINLKFKGIDILVSSVGSGIGTRDVVIDKKKWDYSWNKNFLSFKNTFDCFYKLVKKKHGNIIAISSITGKELLNAPVEYSVAKKTLSYFCKNMSKKIDKNMRINVVSPGNIMQEGNSWDKKIRKNKKKVVKYIESNVPLQRFASANEVANVVLFLSSSKASFVNGEEVVVDGGQLNH
ncbi:SDR family oxidoreductase [Candidatus Pelagibacter sp.]|nr:SDR family oxidoreductase [Candidatus Pelagibacter sp.]